MAFFSPAQKPWLYSGMTKTKQSAASTVRLQERVCSWTYWRILGRLGSSISGRASSARSVTPTENLSSRRHWSANHEPIGSPARPGRVLAMTTCSANGVGPGSPLTGITG